MSSREKSPSRLGPGETFDDSAKQSVIRIANEFSETLSLIQSMRASQIPHGKLTLLVLAAVTSRPKSIASTKSLVRHVSGVSQFYLGARGECAITLTGDSPLVDIREFAESPGGRGRTVPTPARRALTVWSDALGIDWPIASLLVISAAAIETNEEPKQAPEMDSSTVRQIEQTSTDAQICAYKRAFASGIVLATYASLRFSDVQRPRPFGTNEDSVRGTLLCSKT